jgi:hypothetical protein
MNMSTQNRLSLTHMSYNVVALVHIGSKTYLLLIIKPGGKSRYYLTELLTFTVHEKV